MRLPKTQITIDQELKKFRSSKLSLIAKPSIKSSTYLGLGYEQSMKS